MKVFTILSGIGNVIPEGDGNNKSEIFIPIMSFEEWMQREWRGGGMVLKLESKMIETDSTFS